MRWPTKAKSTNPAMKTKAATKSPASAAAFQLIRVQYASTRRATRSRILELVSGIRGVESTFQDGEDRVRHARRSFDSGSLTLPPPLAASKPQVPG